MSVSPVVATAVTTILGLLTVLVPVYFQDQANRQSAAKAAAGQPETPGTQLPLPPLGIWLFPFAGMLLIGVLAGVAIRVNDTLNFRHARSLSEHYKTMGFDEEQTKSIMAGHALKLASVAPVLPEMETPSASILHSMTRPTDWERIWNANVSTSDTDEVNLAKLKKLVDDKTRLAIELLENQKRPVKEILDALSPRSGRPN